MKAKIDITKILQDNAGQLFPAATLHVRYQGEIVYE
jgi:hypothetical protein